MSALAAIIGVGVVAAALMFFSFQLDREEHGILRFLVILFCMALVLLVPKFVMDDQEVCGPVMANATVAGNLTSYEYEAFCFERAEQTPSTFYKLILWFYYLFLAYCTVYLAWLGLRALWDSHKRGRI